MSALSSKNWDKYEYLTGEDLGLKPSTVEQTKFEYATLGLNKIKLKVLLRIRVILFMIVITLFFQILQRVWWI